MAGILSHSDDGGEAIDKPIDFDQPVPSMRSKIEGTDLWCLVDRSYWRNHLKKQQEWNLAKKVN